MSKKENWVRASLVLALGTHTAYADKVQQPGRGTTAPQPDMSQLREQVLAQALRLTEQQRQIDESRRRLEALQRQLESLMAEPARNVKLAQASGKGIQGDTPNIDQPVGQAPQVTRTNLDVATVFAQPSILTPKSTFVFDPSLQYSYSSSDRVSIIGFSVLNAVLIGQIDVRSVNRNNWIMSLGGRYGLSERLEVEARLPFIYRSDDTLSRPITSTAEPLPFSADSNGLGDIEVAARYQLNTPQNDDAFYIAGLRFKSRTGKDQYEVAYDTAFNLPKELPTGSGFYSLQPSLSAVLPADPAVFFGGINYAWNIKRDINTTIGVTSIGEVDPGDSVGINFGMGLALNERSSLSLGYEHTWVGKTKVNGREANEALVVQLATLQAGFSYRLSKRASLNLSIGAGLTSDTPDTTITLRLPIKF